MPRYAFQLCVREGLEAEYDERHRAVWPELLCDLKAAGVRNYSIFRRGRMLFLTLEVPSFSEFVQRMAGSDANTRWQAFMADILPPALDKQAGEAFAMMDEVFHLP